MLSLLFAFALAFVQPDNVTTTDLSGTKLTGKLIGLNQNSITLGTAAGEKVLAVEQLIDVRWEPVKAEALPPGQVYLLDGSVLRFASLTTEGREVRVDSPIYGELTISLSQVRAIRFGKKAEAADAWISMLQRNRSKDLLVLPKKKKAGELDPTTGVIGKIGAESLTFVLGGDEIPVKRTRVYGVIYARKPVAPTGGFVVEASGDRIAASDVKWNAADSVLEVQAAGGRSMPVRRQYLSRVDCSGGKIRYLDEMKPVFYDFASVLPDELYKKIFRYRVNETMDGQPLRLGGKTYSRGLWIHSKTTLRYSLDGEYSRFETVAGIDDDIPRRDKTKARLTIKADERVLFDEDVWITDKPRQLKLNIADAQTLEIVVGFGEKRADGSPPLHAALQDWVDLADAKVLK